jgi:murein DD-endopeptidase MepM/ murein hydrolase activator NlpD
MRKAAGYTIIVHRDGAVDSRSYRVPLWIVRAGAIAGGGLALLAFVGAVLYAPIVRTAARVPSLNRELERLRAENEQVRGLAAALERVESRYRQVRTMLGGDVVPTMLGQEDEVHPSAPPLFVLPPGRAPRYEPGPSIPRHWPLDARGVITRGTVGAGSGAEVHAGLDIAAPRGTPIRAAGGGVVARAGRDNEYGLFVLLQHPEGYRSMYGHASRLLVAAGDSVQAGQVIGLTGSTGRSTAPHLHFEIRQSDRQVDPRSMLNPEES